MDERREQVDRTADHVAMPAKVAPPQPVIGIELGLSTAAACSEGTQGTSHGAPGGPLTKLRRYQRHSSRLRDAAARRQGIDPSQPLPKGTRLTPSKRMLHTRRSIARLLARIADAQRDHQHQLTAHLVMCAHVIAIDDLVVKPMQRDIGCEL